MNVKNPNHRRRNRLLTKKQQVFFKLLCQGVSATDAAYRAGYSQNNPSQSAYQASRGLRERIPYALFEAGLTPEGLIHKHLLPALQAEETGFVKHKGKITDSRKAPAWNARLRAIELAADMGGYFSAKPANLEVRDSPSTIYRMIDVSGMRPARQKS
jgi:hypothetical protein